MLKREVLMLVLIAIFLCSCQAGNNRLSQPLPQEQLIKIQLKNLSVTEPKILQIPNSVDYAKFYKNSQFIELYGIDKERAVDLLSPINPKYFEGIEVIKFIYSKFPDVNIKVEGLYTPNHIEIDVYNQTDNELRLNILHELKHHYCWITKKEINVDYKFYFMDNNPNGAWVYTHNGCFLHTPIDDEFGFIK